MPSYRELELLGGACACYGMRAVWLV